MKSWTKKKDHSSPRRGIEPRSPAWQAGILITIPPRNYMLRFLCRPSFTKCGFEQNPEVKKIILLLGGELSFGLPRDRRGCSPLYYRGTALAYRLRTIFHQVSRGISKSNAEPKKVYSSPRRWIQTGLSRDGRWKVYSLYSEELHVEVLLSVEKIILLTQMRVKIKKELNSSTGNWVSVSRVTGRRYSPLYYRGITCLDFFEDRLSPNAVLFPEVLKFWIKSWSKKDHSSPRRGIEFRSPRWQAGILEELRYTIVCEELLKGVFK